MAGHETSEVRPAAEQNELYIAAGSPLAIQGIFLEILRERFGVDKGLQWEWKPDLATTGILIETSFNEETEARTQIPALYVTRYRSIPQETHMGDRAGVRLKDHFEGFSALMRVDMGVECVSPDKGESCILGDTVQFTLLTAQDVIQRAFGLHSFSHPVLGRTNPFEQDSTKFSTSVEFYIEFWVRWAQVPIAPLLQQLAQRVTIEGKDTFRTTVLNSMRRATADE